MSVQRSQGLKKLYASSSHLTILRSLPLGTSLPPGTTDYLYDAYAGE